jgi:MFS family permease
MRSIHLWSSWKYPSLLLTAIGISNIGDWIYFIALNLIVFESTGSPLTVSGLYIIRPAAVLLTNFWAGSLIDRISKRKLMAILDFIRTALTALIPFLDSIWLIYAFVLMISMGSAMFRPASITYVTISIPAGQRKRFNAIHSLISSGAFLLGPAVAGILLQSGSSALAVYINSLSLLLSGLLTLCLPEMERRLPEAAPTHRLAWTAIKEDWALVLRFFRQARYIITICLLFTFVMMFTAALDSLEVAFAKQVLSLTDSQYGYLVSIAGAGIAAGAAVNVLLAQKWALSWLMGGGCLFVAAGYVVFSLSDTFAVAGIGFFILAFFLAFANTGYTTFYQNNIPADKMGRISSVYGIAEALLQILAVLISGWAAQLLSVQAVVITGAFAMLVAAGLLCLASLIPSRRQSFAPATPATRDA